MEGRRIPRVFSPFRTRTSVPHSVLAPTQTRISSGPMSGLSTSATSILPGPWNTAAIMATPHFDGNGSRPPYGQPRVYPISGLLTLPLVPSSATADSAAVFPETRAEARPLVYPPLETPPTPT